MKNGKRPPQNADESRNLADRSAIFCRVEGALVAAEPVVAAAWCAANSQRLRQRVLRLARLGAGALLDVPVRLTGRGPFSTRAWTALRGISEDRLVVLGEEYARRYLLSQISDARRALVMGERRAGTRLVLVSDYIDAVVAPVAELLQADLLWCNRLEFSGEGATGNLRAPILNGVVDTQAVQEFAALHRIDLKTSLAFGAPVTDAALLKAVGHPCPLKPEHRKKALSASWHRPLVHT